MINCVKKLAVFTILLIYTISFITPNVMAITDEQKELMRKNILYYNLESCDIADAKSDDTTPVSGGNNVEKVIRYFTGKGLSLEQAAGMVGNLAVESGDPKLDPAATENAASYKQGPQSGVGYGLAQWTTAGRQQGLVNYAKSRNKPVYDFDVQLGYLWKELRSTPFYGLDKLKKTTSVEQATKVFMDNFERPGVPHFDRRLKYAEETYNFYKDKDIAPATSTSDETTSVDENCTCESSSSPGSTTKVDIEEIAKKNDLQSAMAIELGGETVAAYNENEPPASPASTMKLVIVDTVMRENIDLGKEVSVGSEVLYDGKNDLGSSTITLKEAVQKTLSVSSNVGANVLVKALGGVNEFSNKADKHGYKGTVMKDYYSTSAQGKNKSTISDQVKAMNHIFSEEGDDYQVARGALKSAAKNNNYYGLDNEANKWAGNSKVAGNVGLFNINGTRYIIGVYHNGSQPAAPAKNKIKSGSEEILNELKNLSDASGTDTGGVDESCSEVGGQGNGSVQDIVAFATKYAWKDGRRTLDMDPEYKSAINKVAGKEYIGGIAHPGIDCGGFVTRVMRDSGADPKYNTGPEGPTSRQQAYMDENPDKYERLGQLTNASKLQPGDIAVNSGHTFIYTGKQDGVAGDSIGASLDSYAPRAHGVYFEHSSGLFTWYRLKK